MTQGSKLLSADGRRTTVRQYRLDSAALTKLRHARDVLNALGGNITDSTLVRMALSVLVTELVDPTVEAVNEGRDDGRVLVKLAEGFNSNDADGAELLSLRCEGELLTFNERRVMDVKPQTMEEQHSSMLGYMPWR